MIDLQELIIRARFIFSGAPKRLDVFHLINGENSTKEIAKKVGRSLSSVLQDIKKLKDFEIIQERKSNSTVLKKDGAKVFEKVPLIKHIPNTYFNEVADTTKFVKRKVDKVYKTKSIHSIHVPIANEILDISKEGENQFYEFKAPGSKMEDLSREIAAFAFTKSGGIIFYGIGDYGTIIGSDIKRQDFDQRIHNSIKYNIDPRVNINIIERNVLGAKILMIVIPPWDRKSLYQFTKKERFLIRKGTNVFAVSSEELKKLSSGIYVI